jgi:hypothetical protein
MVGGIARMMQHALYAAIVGWGEGWGHPSPGNLTVSRLILVGFRGI